MSAKIGGPRVYNNMTLVKLGKSGIVSPKNAFGALPIQRITIEESTALIQRAYEAGITYYDTARFYTDSEKKLGIALRDVRDKIIIATKTMCTTTEQFWEQLETSLTELQTDYIDLYQFHNPAVCPKPGDGSGLYEAMLEAKEQGKIRHIGITNHRLAVAKEAVLSGLYETLQFPFSYVASEEEMELVKLCKEHNVGFIAMKGMAGGLLTDGRIAYAFMEQYDNVLPIWGVQRMSELEEFIGCIDNPPVYDEAMQAFISKERKNLMGEFCRGCGYCMPCPKEIQINDCARMSLMIRRAPTDVYFNESYQAKMQQIRECIKCGQCASRCPYGLDTPQLLEKNLADYEIELAKYQASL